LNPSSRAAATLALWGPSLVDHVVHAWRRPVERMNCQAGARHAVGARIERDSTWGRATRSFGTPSSASTCSMCERHWLARISPARNLSAWPSWKRTLRAAARSVAFEVPSGQSESTRSASGGSPERCPAASC
jgi:hypothetical protein